jgi:hypothetical protein
MKIKKNALLLATYIKHDIENTMVKELKYWH